MTRENKLALVVGFGLMLFVGILISDHFSTARNQESADIRSGRLVDPLALDRHGNPSLIEVPGARADAERSGGNLRAGPLAMNPGQMAGESSDPRAERRERTAGAVPPRNEIPRIVMGASNDVEGVDARRDDRAASGPFVFHDVQPGETLTSIARKHYGDGSLMRALAQFNGIENPNTIRVGHRLRIPEVSALGRTPRTNDAAAESEPPSPVYTTYVVQRGDTLSEISQQLLGTARRWREIYEMNSQVIRDPNNLAAGSELKIPRPGR